MNKPFDPNKPCRTRGGDPVKILTTDAIGSFPIYYQNEKTRAVCCTYPNGKALSNCDCELDLVNVPIKLVGWVNAARDAEQLAKERAEKNVCTLQDALFQILMHTESYNYNSYQRIISKIAKMAVKALKESGAKLEKTR